MQVIQEDLVPAGASWDSVIHEAQSLKIIDLNGHQGVDFLCYNADDPHERYHAPNTIKAMQSIHVAQGTVLYSDYANAMMTVTRDTVGGHDTIAGCCSSWSNEMLYGVKGIPGCRENFLAALEQHGLGWRDIVPNINFFCSVPIYENGSTAEAVFVEGGSRPGDFVELRANMNVLAILSNCPQVNNPCNSGQPTPIKVQILK